MLWLHSHSGVLCVLKCYELPAKQVALDLGLLISQSAEIRICAGGNELSHAEHENKVNGYGNSTDFL